MEYNPLEEYGPIGDRNTVALVSHDGSSDCCLLPHGESPSTFVALLDVDHGDPLSTGPLQPKALRQRFRSIRS